MRAASPEDEEEHLQCFLYFMNNYIIGIEYSERVSTFFFLIVKFLYFFSIFAQILIGLFAFPFPQVTV